MLKIEQLREKISTITEIYIGVKENFRFCFHLHHFNSELESKYLAIDKHLQFIRHSLWRLTVIELCKLFSAHKNDKYDIKTLLDNLKPGGHFGKLEFDVVKIQAWGNEVNKKNIVIKNINDLRDKIYAHTDPEREIYRNIDIYFNDVSELLELANQIIQEISIQIKEPLLLFDSPYFESQNFDLVKILAENHYNEIQKLNVL